jgi:hypothetical protein
MQTDEEKQFDVIAKLTALTFRARQAANAKAGKSQPIPPLPSDDPPWVRFVEFALSHAVFLPEPFRDGCRTYYACLPGDMKLLTSDDWTPVPPSSLDDVLAEIERLDGLITTAQVRAN